MPATPSANMLPSPQHSSSADADRNTSDEAVISQAYKVIYAAFCEYCFDENEFFYLSQQSFELLLRKSKSKRKCGADPIYEVFKVLFQQAVYAELQRIATEVPSLKPFFQRRGAHYSGSVSLLTTDETDTGIQITSRKAAVFRGAWGEPVPGELKLPFVSFLPLEERHLLPADGQNATLHIAFEHLATLLGKAESVQRVYESTPPPP
ncbi:hypothetical protein F4824DRAFT_501698 [Ustulina deusta]|nr:hypothetical protein F4824DRAFT_501698 [Ustulina deusta]